MGENFWRLNVDYPASIQPCLDGTGYLIAGQTASTDGNITNPIADKDGWIFKIDLAGNLEWQKSIGGTGSDALGGGIIEEANHDLVVAGGSKSNDGDASGSHGNLDFWVAKLKAGEIVNVSNLRAGDWSDPTIWSNNHVPDQNSVVTISYEIFIDVNAEVKSLKANSKVTVGPGVKVVVTR
jgi:hypothetical protein